MAGAERRGSRADQSEAEGAWPLVGRPRPEGASRRSAIPPIVPLAVLDDDDAPRTLAEAVAARLRQAEVRTVNRELSALRSAISWWRRREWITADPTALLASSRVRTPGDFALMPSATRARTPGGRLLSDADVGALFREPAGLREQAFWRLLRDSSVGVHTVLALDAHAIDLRNRRARTAVADDPLEWGAATGDLLGWLLAGRRCGPVFLTDRRAPADTATADRCPLSGRGRMSYRRAAEIFVEHTRLLDPAGRGWTLHQLRRPAR